ncbi:MAG: hypothetical protein QOD43_2067, partial [Gaiellaceae bacterium]|nr:hypothetical protein [Gaiellaceae bacterium]
GEARGRGLEPGKDGPRSVRHLDDGCRDAAVVALVDLDDPMRGVGTGADAVRAGRERPRNRDRHGAARPCAGLQRRDKPPPDSDLPQEVRGRRARRCAGTAVSHDIGHDERAVVLSDGDRSLDQIGAGGSGERAPATQADDDDEGRAG